MNVLALDTSGDRSTVGLSTASGLVLEAATDGSRKHGRDLMPCVRDVLRSAEVRPSDLNLVGVGLGPGSYTGLRIGLTAARMLAYAVGARIASFDSLEAFAWNAPGEAMKIRVVADAQRGDVYRTDFERIEVGGPLVCLIPSRIEPFDRWLAGLEHGDWIVGPGLNLGPIRSALPAGVVALESALNQPSGRILAALTQRVAASGPACDLWALEPNYMRRSAAEDQWDARSGRA